MGEPDIPKDPKTEELAVTPELLADPEWVAAVVAKMVARLRSSPDPLDEKRRIDALVAAHHTITSVLEHKQAPLQELVNSDDVLSIPEEQLLGMRHAMAHTRGLRREKKRRWYQVIDGVIEMQRLARKSADACMVYVGQDETAPEGFFLMSDVHRALFDIWEDPDRPNSLSMVHPAVGKSTCLRFYIAKLVAEWPNVRIAVIGDSAKRVEGWIGGVRQIISSPRYRALFPHVRILRSSEGRPNNAASFTINRTKSGLGLTEPTCRAIGVESRVQGLRFDVMIYDDATPEEHRDNADLLRKMWNRYLTVWSKRLDVTGRQREVHISTLWGRLDLGVSVRALVKGGGYQDWRIAVDEFSIRKLPDGTYTKIWPERYGDDYYRAVEAADAGVFRLQFAQKLDRQDDKIINRVRHFFSTIPDEYTRLAAPEDLARARKRLVELEKGENWLSIDSAFSSNQASCDTCVGRLTIAPWRTAYLRQCWFMPGNAVELQTWIIRRIAGDKLFEERYESSQDSPESRRKKRSLSESQVSTAGDVDHVLIEGNAIQKGSAEQLQWNVAEGLRRMGVVWSGAVHLEDVTGRTRMNASKAERLGMAALPLSNGLVRFPAYPVFRENHEISETARWHTETIADDGVIRLLNQLRDAPHGKWDGCDMISQFVKHHLSVLQPEPDEFRIGGADVQEDDFAKSLRESIRQMMESGQDTNDPLQEEDEWNGYSELWSSCAGSPMVA